MKLKIYTITIVLILAASVQAQQVQSIVVLAYPVWTDTGISLTNGEIVSITVSGSWTIGSPEGTPYTGPDGYTSGPNDNTVDNFYLYAPHGALISYVGSDPFQGHDGDASFFPQTSGYWNIGSSNQFVSPQGGELWLGINDGAVSGIFGQIDNAGSMNAQITINPTSPILPIITNLTTGPISGGIFQNNVDMVIEGSGFGTTNGIQNALTNLIVYEINPTTGTTNWSENGTGISISSWADNGIDIASFNIPLFNGFNSGDELLVQVQNPQTQSGFATSSVILNQTFLEIDIRPSSNYPLVLSDNEMQALFASIRSQLQQEGLTSSGMIAVVGPSTTGTVVDIGGMLLLAGPQQVNDFLADDQNLFELGAWGTAASGADLGSTIAAAWPTGVNWDPILNVLYSAQYAVEAQYLQHSCFTSHVTSAVSQPRVDFAICGTLNQLTIILPLSSHPSSTIDLQNILGNWAWGIGNIPWNNPFGVEQLEETPCSQSQYDLGLTVNEYAYTTPGVFGLYGYPIYTAKTWDFFGGQLGTNVLVPSAGTPPLFITTSNSPAACGTNSGSLGAYSNSVATVTATPNPGYSFSCWSQNGLIVTLLSNYTFTATASETLVANFTTNFYTVATTNSPSDAGTTTGDTNTFYDASVTVTANANLGYSFANWTTPDGTFVNASSNYTFTVGSNVVLVANYAAVGSSIITTVASPSFAGSTSGGGTYTNAQSETLAAIATDSCYSFTNWTTNGIVCSTSPTNTITVTINLLFTANFAPISYNIAVSASSGGSVSGGGLYNCGDAATFRAIPNPCYSFVNWTENGSPVSGLSDFYFVVDTNHNFVANFAPITNNVGTSSSPANGGTTSGGGTVGCQANVTVAAVPNSGYSFANWTENGVIVSTSTNYTFMPSGIQSLVANFVPNVPTLGFGSPPWYAGNLDLILQGPIGSNYEIDASTDLFNWLPSTNFISTSSPFYFTVPAATNASQGFYRAVMP